MEESVIIIDYRDLLISRQTLTDDGLPYVEFRTLVLVFALSFSSLTCRLFHLSSFTRRVFLQRFGNNRATS